MTTACIMVDFVILFFPFEIPTEQSSAWTMIEWIEEIHVNESNIGRLQAASWDFARPIILSMC